jgi:predicted ATP-grasp superfamily ATP-dependent carboligase
VEQENKTGAVVFPCTLGGLAIIRTLGRRGIPVIAIDSNRWAHGMLSRYCAQRVTLDQKPPWDAATVETLVRLGRTLPSKYVMYPASDQALLLASRYRSDLLPHFQLNFPEHDLLENLVSKQGMYRLAVEHGLPTPKTLFPSDESDVAAFSEQAMYPCLLKTVYSHSPLKQVGKVMVKVFSRGELLSHYRTMAAIDPQVMIQEYIPGEDHQMFLYDAYFDDRSQPKLVFTGRKLRQVPINFGAGCLCECETFPELERLVTGFCKALGYKGLVDIGLKWDARDGKHKVLDINPRIGQNFRTFVTKHERIDLALAAYLDLTGRPITDTAPLEGRRWMIEDSDLLSSIRYYRAGRLSPREWMNSFRGVQELAIFDFRDPLPWMVRYVETLTVPLWVRLKRILSPTPPNPLPPSAANQTVNRPLQICPNQEKL